MRIVKVETTVESEDAANALAKLVLSDRVAACIQCEPIVSHYRWDNRVVCDAEVRLTCKTTQEKHKMLVAFLQKKHTYDVPEIVSSLIEVSETYGSWVRDEVAHDGS